MTKQPGGTRNGIVERLARAKLSREEDETRKAILKVFAAEGRAPHVQEVARALGLPFGAGARGLPHACKARPYSLEKWRWANPRCLSLLRAPHGTSGAHGRP